MQYKQQPIPRLLFQVQWSYGAVYSITTFIRAITSLLQIRQVARLRSTTCNQHGLTNNPVQKPNFRGQGTKRKETPTDQKSPRPRRYIGEDRPKRKPKAEVLPRGSRASKAKGDRRGKEAAVASGWRLSEGGRVLEVASLVNGRSHSGQRYRRKEAAVSAFRFAHLWRSFRLCCR